MNPIIPALEARRLLPRKHRVKDWAGMIASEYPEAGALMERMLNFSWKDSRSAAKSYKLMRSGQFTLRHARLLYGFLRVENNYGSKFPHSIKQVLAKREVLIQHAIDRARNEAKYLEKKRIEMFRNPELHDYLLKDALSVLSRGRNLIPHLQWLTMAKMGGRCWPFVYTAKLGPSAEVDCGRWADEWSSAEPEFQERVRAVILKEFSVDLAAYLMPWKSKMEPEEIYGVSMNAVAKEFSKALTEVLNREEELEELIRLKAPE
jgi:hypothetical protein